MKDFSTLEDRISNLESGMGFLIIWLLLLTIGLLVFTRSAHAQDLSQLPDKPQPTAAVLARDARLHNEIFTICVTQIKDTQPEPGEPGYHWYKDPWLVSAYISMAGTTVADAQTTLGALHRGFTEQNPIFGEHPGPGRLYGILVPVTGFEMWATYYFRTTVNKQGKHDTLWLFPVILHDLVHGGAAIWNAHLGHAHRAPPPLSMSSAHDPSEFGTAR